MDSSVQTVPMTKREGAREFVLSDLPEAFSRFAGRTAGKLLCVSDRTGYRALSFAAQLPRTVSVVLSESDALPLFSLTEGAGGIFAAGGAETLRAARFYASLHRIPCAVAPSSASLEGAFGAFGAVTVGGEKGEFALAEAELCLSEPLFAPSAGEAYARLLLARLALFERRALTAFGEPPDPLSEKAFPILGVLDGEPTACDVARAHFDLAPLYEEGLHAGEGIILAGLYPAPDPFRAFSELYALYAAFFRRGKPRSTLVPDYMARAKHAGTGVSLPPTAEEYAKRALILERRRAELFREVEVIGKRHANYLSNYLRLGGEPPRKGDLTTLKYLPEHAKGGLSAVIRDFGLMEWE